MSRKLHYSSDFRLPLSRTPASHFLQCLCTKQSHAVSYAPHNTFVKRRGIVHLISRQWSKKTEVK